VIVDLIPIHPTMRHECGACLGGHITIVVQVVPRPQFDTLIPNVIKHAIICTSEI
jgi:hypothetical protein